MSHTANSDKGARKQVSRREKSNVMPCQLIKILERKKKKRQSTFCFTHQELLVISDGAAESANAVASELLFTQREEKATKPLLPPEHHGQQISQI